MNRKMAKAVYDIRTGKPVIIIDEKRECEGDFICSATCVTHSTLNMILTEARGAFIACFTEHGLCRSFGISPQIPQSDNTESNKTQMMVSVDANGVVSGSSVADRVMTLHKLSSYFSQPNDFIRPGHIIPIEEAEGGILVRPGHTEAGVALMRMASIEPAVAVDMEILDSDGKMADNNYLERLSHKYGIQIITIEEIIEAIK